MKGNSSVCFALKGLKCIMYRSTIYWCIIGKIGVVRWVEVIDVDNLIIMINIINVWLWNIPVYHNAQRQKRAHDWDKATKKVQCDWENAVKELLKRDNDDGLSTKVK